MVLIIPSTSTDTKSQYARDDPAFLVLLVISLCRKYPEVKHSNMEHFTTISLLSVSSFAISIVTHKSAVDRVFLLLYVVFVDFLVVGVIVATIMWLLVNKLFRMKHEQDVEWAYAFDIHINAFFPPSLLLHFFQMFFYNGKLGNVGFAKQFSYNLTVCTFRSHQSPIFSISTVWKRFLVLGPELLRVH